jgi:hypothetical protein
MGRARITSAQRVAQGAGAIHLLRNDARNANAATRLGKWFNHAMNHAKPAPSGGGTALLRP